MTVRIDGSRRGAAPDYSENSGAVRRMRLARRRTRVPWIYLVYHARPRRRGAVTRTRAVA